MWRESLEAALIVGILLTYLARSGEREEEGGEQEAAGHERPIVENAFQFQVPRAAGTVPHQDAAGRGNRRPVDAVRVPMCERSPGSRSRPAQAGEAVGRLATAGRGGQPQLRSPGIDAAPRVHRCLPRRGIELGSDLREAARAHHPSAHLPFATFAHPAHELSVDPASEKRAAFRICARLAIRRRHDQGEQQPRERQRRYRPHQTRCTPCSARAERRRPSRHSAQMP